MSTDYRNKEGYADPTPFEAIYKEPRFEFHPVVYIASAYAGDIKKMSPKRVSMRGLLLMRAVFRSYPTFCCPSLWMRKPSVPWPHRKQTRRNRATE